MIKILFVCGVIHWGGEKLSKIRFFRGIVADFDPDMTLTTK